MERFEAEIELNGKTATGIRVPAEVVERLGSGKRSAVKVTVRSYTYRSTIARYGGVYFLPLSRANREAAGVEAGQVVDVAVDLDVEPRKVEVPDDLARALAASPKAADHFEGLSYT
ncbi:MAG: YdeI/OmpD-associated family protein, partial [Acidimicrobiia bacterium]